MGFGRLEDAKHCGAKRTSRELAENDSDDPDRTWAPLAAAIGWPTKNERGLGGGGRFIIKLHACLTQRLDRKCKLPLVRWPESQPFALISFQACARLTVRMRASSVQ